jgi:hypothetical protein
MEPKINEAVTAGNIAPEIEIKICPHCKLPLTLQYKHMAACSAAMNRIETAAAIACTEDQE